METVRTEVLQIPSKWEIIPIHNSDRGSFKNCRRRWDWSSPASQNLTPNVGMMGVNTNLWFGTGIHYALEQYYNPLLKRDPVESFKTWFDIQWRGGVITEDWLDKVCDLNPQPYTAITHGVPSWKVRGLEDLLPDPDHLVFDELFELGIGMMTFYKQYAEKNDDFEIVMVEHDFSVPIWDYANDRILRAIDKREDSPNFGKELEVHARGRMDAITRRIGTDKLSVMDHKTASSIKEEYFLKLETDEQVTSYLLCAQIEASYYDLPHKGVPLEECLYNTLRKKYPASAPTELKNGMFSVDRENESVTYDILMDWVAVHMPGVALNEKQQGYVDWLRDVGDEQFIIRKHVRRNQHQLKSAGERLYLEALDMLSEPLIYPNLNNDYSCLNCVFRVPCLAQEDGSDWQQLINDNYSSNRDR